MTVNTTAFEETVTMTRTISHVAINSRIVCAKVTTGGELVNFTSKESEKQFESALRFYSNEMVLTNENLALLLSGEPYSMEKVISVSNQFLHCAKTLGFMSAVEEHEEELRTKSSIFDLVSSGGELNLVNISQSDHLIFDIDGEILPTGIRFSYLSGNFRDGAYDMTKALAILQATPSVRPIGDSLEITSVPYYNNSPGCSLNINFVFAPTDQQMRDIWAEAKRIKSKYPSTAIHTAVFNLDVLGLRAGGAAHGDTYYFDKYSQ